MFCVTHEDVAGILRDYGIAAELRNVIELQRYDYEREDPDSKEVRLIVKLELADAPSLVLRFKNEEDVTLDLLECQCAFAHELKRHGILTPSQHQSNGRFANPYTIGGYEVFVTLEQFVEGEVKLIDPQIAKKIGELLGRSHRITEEYDLHVNNDVLFDPFTDNDLFDFEGFLSVEPLVQGEAKLLFDQIVATYHSYMDLLAPLRKRRKYAVQGDISNCNLYLSPCGEVGVFDFNRAGDNVLFCDAVMQGIFEAKLMDYPEDREEDFEAKILLSFWAGYCSVRSLTAEERKLYPYLHAIIHAFWTADIRWSENSLLNAYEAKDEARVHKWLSTIWDRLTHADILTHNMDLSDVLEICYLGEQ